MALTDVLARFRDIEAAENLLNAKWYIVAAAALAAAGAGPDVPTLYKLATENTTLETEKLVQRRIKEAILKTSCLYGVPKSLQALLPLFSSLSDAQIDDYGPRMSCLTSSEPSETQKTREAKGKRYFDTLWGADAATFHRERNFKYQPDLYLLNLTMIYEWHMSEDAILNNIETQTCNSAALICSNCPVQAMWHTRGIIRHGGRKEEAKFAQDLGLAVAHLYGCKTGEIIAVENIELESKSPH